ncbi:hypothetical protein NDU88_004954 [Pleurodeles waltl]|uniref:Uncharacterized protein n=1 Tax=Pleurodeles waltl TaxID=8319 RepID=A0AAV7PGE5_PLEWA|nr:hypothetical protein NDU88_004954 [Pleurodeles waltl]
MTLLSRGPHPGTATLNGTTWGDVAVGGSGAEAQPLGPHLRTGARGAPERTGQTPRPRRRRTRRDRKRNAVHTGPTKCAPDLEQLIQERREAIHTAATISASPLPSGSDTELSQPASDRPLTPDHLLESDLTGGPPVTPATADELF